MKKGLLIVLAGLVLALGLIAVSNDKEEIGAPDTYDTAAIKPGF